MTGVMLEAADSVVCEVLVCVNNESEDPNLEAIYLARRRSFLGLKPVHVLLPAVNLYFRAVSLNSEVLQKHSSWQVYYIWVLGLRAYDSCSRAFF